MSKPPQARPSPHTHCDDFSCLGSAPGAIRLLVAALVAGLLNCSGSSASGDHAGQLNGHFQITPATATVVAGQTFRFAANSSWGDGAIWSVLPGIGGTIDPAGTFTAATPGQYQIVAMWRSDVRYTATATVTVVPAPPATHPSLGMVQAFGQRQGSADGSVRNAPVIGEPLPAQTAASASGTVQVRHGFHLPPAR